MLWGFCFMVKMRSPRAKSGTYSPYRSSIMFSLFSIPCSMSMVICESSCTSLFPLHCPHLAFISLPFPPQRSQWVYIYICIPNPTWTFCMTTPRPWHLLQVVNLPSLAPVPAHLLQYMFLLTFRVLLVPKYRSASDTWMSALAFGPFFRAGWPLLKRKDKEMFVRTK